MVSLLIKWRTGLSLLWKVLKVHFRTSLSKDLEILALRSQLALYEERHETGKVPKTRPTPSFRRLWVFLSKLFPLWKEALILVKPETVVGWHKRAFQLYWKRKSKRKGRPPLTEEIISLIRQIHQDNPLWSPQRVRAELVKLGLSSPPAPNTIAKYLKPLKRPPSDRQTQSWKSFISNHMDLTWATDFFTIPSLSFKILYVLVIMEHKSRKILHVGVTKNPNSFWLKNQFVQATPFNRVPSYLIHDNDPVFKSAFFQGFLKTSGIKSVTTAYRSPWQNAYAERLIGTIRRELLDHVVPINERHLEKLLKSFVHDYYNPHRTHQGLGGGTPIPSPEVVPVDIKDFKFQKTPVLNGLCHSYQRVA